MEAYQERVLTEKRELDEKIMKLRAFTATPGWRALNPVERSRLDRQLGAMSLYSGILAERIGAFT